MNINNCSTKTSLDNNNNCIPEPSTNQYKCPCDFLPLDGSKQNVYPLSNNPLNTQTGGNCGDGSSDCFNKNIQEIGSTPTCNNLVSDAQSVSQNAFYDRYCCGYNDAGAGNNNQVGGKYNLKNIKNILNKSNKFRNLKIHSGGNYFNIKNINSKNDMKNLRNFLIKNGISKNKIKLNTVIKNNKQTGGGVGYYLAIEKPTIGGLAEIKCYNANNPPIFNGQLLKGGKSLKKYNKNKQKGSSHTSKINVSNLAEFGSLPGNTFAQGLGHNAGVTDQMLADSTSYNTGGSKTRKYNKFHKKIQKGSSHPSKINVSDLAEFGSLPGNTFVQGLGHNAGVTDQMLADSTSYNTGGSKTKKLKKKKQIGGNNSVCSDFSANLCNRKLDCVQPNWSPKCI